MNLGRTGISSCSCLAGLGCACAGGQFRGLGAADASGGTGKILGAVMILGLTGAWAVWFIATHPLKPEYARAGARF